MFNFEGVYKSVPRSEIGDCLRSWDAKAKGSIRSEMGDKQVTLYLGQAQERVIVTIDGLRVRHIMRTIADFEGNRAPLIRSYTLELKGLEGGKKPVSVQLDMVCSGGRYNGVQIKIDRDYFFLPTLSSPQNRVYSPPTIQIDTASETPTSPWSRSPSSLSTTPLNLPGFRNRIYFALIFLALSDTSLDVLSV